MSGHLVAQGMVPVDASRLFATFYVGDPTFGGEAAALAEPAGPTAPESGDPS